MNGEMGNWMGGMELMREACGWFDLLETRSKVKKLPEKALGFSLIEEVSSSNGSSAVRTNTIPEGSLTTVPNLSSSSFAPVGEGDKEVDPKVEDPFAYLYTEEEI